MNQVFHWQPNEVILEREAKDCVVIEIHRRGRKELYLDIHAWLSERLGPMDLYKNWFILFDMERNLIIVSIKNDPKLAMLFKLTWA